MGRDSSISRLDWASNVDPTAASGVFTTAQMILGCLYVSITVRQTPGNAGTISGSFKLQITDFGTSDNVSTGPLPLSADWVDVPGSATVWSGGPVRWALSAPAGKFIRVVFTDSGSSGSPKVDAAFSGSIET